MKVLIVDDQYEKVEVFARCLKEASISDITHVTSSFQALDACMKNQYDLMILDIQIPERIGDAINKKGGVNLLETIELDNKIMTPIHVVVATSYEESYVDFHDYFDRKGWKLLRDLDDEEAISDIINAISKHSLRHQSYDYALLAVLPHIEQEAIFNLPLVWKEEIEFNDANKYYTTEFFNAKGVKKNIVTTCCPRMGIASSAAIAMKILLKFNPRCLIMTGIAAGIKGRCNIGDILVADPCWDWGSGKMTVENGKPKFLSAPHQIPLKTGYRTILKEMAVKRTFLDEIYEGWIRKNISTPKNKLSLRVGPVATGAVVIEDPETLNLVVTQNRETIGVEMEAYGMLASTIYLKGNSSIDSLIVKSVCDFANIDKNDEWQAYAAYTSTEFAYKLIDNDLI